MCSDTTLLYTLKYYRWYRARQGRRVYHSVRFDAQVCHFSCRTSAQVLGPDRERPGARQVRDDERRRAAAALCPDERRVQDVALGAPRRNRLGQHHPHTLRLGHVVRDHRPVGRVRHVHVTLAVRFVVVHGQTLESAHRRRQARQVDLCQQLKHRLWNMLIL